MEGAPNHKEPIPVADMLPNYKSRLSQQNLAELSKPIEIHNEENLLKTREVAPLIDPNPVITVFGPKIDRGVDPEEIQQFSEKICSRTVSTYPLRSQKQGETDREGDPICDRYGFYLFKNRSIVVVADGCNWGELPKRAAERARNSVMGYLKEKNHKIRCINDAKLYLLRSLNEAHRRICEKVGEEDIGSTTVIAGLTLEIVGENGKPNEWVFVCVSVGDCKAFIIEANSSPPIIKDVTLNNRNGSLNASDCGGRLGPVMPDGGPDLRNLWTYCCRCQPGDLIMVMSDGVHDNLHPAMLNISPKDLNLNFEDWQAAESVLNVEDVACNFRVKFLADLLENVPITPSNIVNRVIEHSIEITKSSRAFMQENPGKRLPRDYGLYPGKMDHTTCLVFRVGRGDDPVTPIGAAPKVHPYVPITVTLAKSSEFLSLYCRTIAKGKFECLAKKTECVLTVSPRKTFDPPLGETVIGSDELSSPISRVVKIPEDVNINIHSKQISYNGDLGIITIRFSLIK